MPGQIKIDDGAGNYTILTNAGSLGSDKTIIIPNTTGTMALTSDITSGITETETWRLTTSFTGSASPITSNLSLAADAGKIGTGMSVSSGVFTFPSTGIYKIFFQPRIVNLGVNNTDNVIRAKIQTTTDNGSNWTTRGEGTNGIDGSNYFTFMNISYIFDVTDTANDKVRFEVSDVPATTTVYASSSSNWTYMEFIRLGDT